MNIDFRDLDNMDEDNNAFIIRAKEALNEPQNTTGRKQLIHSLNEAYIDAIAYQLLRAELKKDPNFNINLGSEIISEPEVIIDDPEELI